MQGERSPDNGSGSDDSMLTNISPKPIHLIEKLSEAGHQAYIVGGAVRDLLLDITPKDYDIATSATPEEVKAVFKRKARIIGRRFRLVHVYHERETFEVSTFRREPTLEERKGRDSDTGLMVWRDNEWGTLEQDARRRDFTVNAVYFNPLDRNNPTRDYVGGMDDLRSKRVRTIGCARTRLAEDPVRMLRACKLCGQYGFTAEADVRDTIVANAEQINLASRARLLEELYKIFKRPYAEPILAACQEHGLLRFMIPALAEAWDSGIGHTCRRLLAARDAGIAARDAARKTDHNADGKATPKIFPSRVTGLAAVALPFLEAELGNGNGEPLWESGEGIDRTINGCIRELFDLYKLPRSMTAKTRDVLMLLPKLHDDTVRGRVIRHPEYPRARDLYQAFVSANGLDDELVARWPPRRRSSKGRGRRSR